MSLLLLLRGTPAVTVPVRAATLAATRRAVRAVPSRITSGSRVPPVIVAILRQRPAAVQRRPGMSLRAAGQPPPVAAQLVTLARRPRLVARGRGVVTGPLAPGTVATVTPIRPAVLALTPRRGPPAARSRVVAGLPPGKGLSGIPVQQTRYPSRLTRRQAGQLRPGVLPGVVAAVPLGAARNRLWPAITRAARSKLIAAPYAAYPVPQVARIAREPSRTVRQPVQRLAAGQRGSLTAPVPVPVVPRHKSRVRPVPSRVVPPPYVPSGAVYQPVTAPARLARSSYRLVRQPPQRLAAGTPPGRGITPPGFARSRQIPAAAPSRSRVAPAPYAGYPPVGYPARLAREPARLVRQPPQRLASGQRGSLSAPVPVPVTLREQQRVRAVPSRLATGMLPGLGLSGIPVPLARSRPGSVQRQPPQRLAAGRVAAPPARPVVLAVARRQARAVPSRLAAGARVPPVAAAPLRQRPAIAQRQPPRRLAAGIVIRPPTAVASLRQRPGAVLRQTRQSLAIGIVPRPPVIVAALRTRPAVPQRQPRATVVTGQRGSLTAPVPVPVTLRHKARIRPAASRLAAGVVPGRVPVPVIVAVRQRVRAVQSRVWVNHYTPPPVAYPPVAYPARIIREPSRLQRQPRMTARTGLLPGFYPGSTGDAAWQTHAGPPRWQARPGQSRWATGAMPSRWGASMAVTRWTAKPSGSRWSVIMVSFAPIAAISLEDVNVTWTSELDGTSIDPTGQTAGQSLLAVQFAFPVSSGNALAPAQPATWYTGSWLLGGTGFGYVAQCLVGPGGGATTLTAGQSYDVWCRITGTPEVPAKYAGSLPVY